MIQINLPPWSNQFTFRDAHIYLLHLRNFDQRMELNRTIKEGVEGLN